MAVSVANQWTGTWGGYDDVEIVTTPTAGNWLVAVVAWRANDGTTPLLMVADWAQNLWYPVATPAQTAQADHPNGQLHTAVWVCPNVAYAGWPSLGVYLAGLPMLTNDTGSMSVTVAELAGMGNGFLTVDSVTVGTASAATTISVTAPAPQGAASCVMVGAAGSASATATLTVTSGGSWVALTQTSSTTPHPQTNVAPQWVQATTGQTASWSSSVAVNLAAVLVAFRVTGTAPTQPNANWPAVQYQLGLGYAVGTPLSAVQWTDLTPRITEMTHQRGIPYELAVAQASETTYKIRNKDGAFTPRTPGSASANATGTTTTILVPTTSAGNINISDFFQLQTAGGALKEVTVFQVSGLASASGTTTVTFARADGTGSGALVATASGDQYAGVQIDVGIPIRTLATWGGKTYPVCTGWIERWPQTWTLRNHGWAIPVAVDALATLTTAVPSGLHGAITSRSPQSYWPLSDAQGGGVAQNASGNGITALTQSTSKNGGGTAGKADFGASTQNSGSGNSYLSVSILGDSGSGWAQSGLVAADMTAGKGFALTGSDPAFPPVSGGVTISGVYFLASADVTMITAGTISPTIVTIRDAAGNAVLRVAINHGVPNSTYGLFPVIVVWDKVTHASTLTNLTAAIPLGPGWFPWAIVFDQGTWSVYVLGFLIGSGTCNLPTNFRFIDIGGEADRYGNGGGFNSIHAHVAIFPRKLSGQEVTELSGLVIAGASEQTPADVTAGFFPLTETTSRKITRKLNTIGWRGSRVINVSDVLAALDNPAAISQIAQHLADIAAGEDALIYVDASGTFQVRGRARSAYQQPMFTLGDGPGEIPYEDNVQADWDNSFIYNQVQVTNSATPSGFGGGQSAAGVATIYTATDAVSVAKYGARNLPRATSLNAVTDATDLAWGLLARYAYPALRVQNVVVDPASNPTLWPFVLGAEIGDIGVLNRRPLTAPMLSSNCILLNISHHTAAGLWKTTLTLGIAPAPVLLLNDPVRGIAGTNVLGA